MSALCQRSSVTVYESAAYVNYVDRFHHRLSVLCREKLLASLPGYRPVHKIQIHVCHAQIIKGLLHSRSDIIWVMLVVPKLGRYEKILAWDSTLLHSFSHGFFGAVSFHISIEIQLTACVGNALRVTYTRAVSIWRYPALIASATASSCSPASCQVPNPMAGISAPVFSLNLVGIMSILRTEV